MNKEKYKSLDQVILEEKMKWKKFDSEVVVQVFLGLIFAFAIVGCLVVLLMVIFGKGTTQCNGFNDEQKSGILCLRV